MDARTKPVFPWQLPLLGGIAVFGLIAQLVAGEAAFALLERDAPYSWFVSFFLEAAAIIAALEIALSYKETKTGGGDWRSEVQEKVKYEVNIPAVVVEIVTLTCSAIFNYTWVSKVLTDAHPVQIAAYSIGPLAALSGIGMTSGNVLRKWLAEMTEWKLTMASQAQAEEDDAVAHQRSLDIKAAELQAELTIEAHQAKLALEAEQIKAEAVERTRAAKVKERIDRKRAKVEAVQVVQERSTTGPEPVLVPGVPVLEQARAILEAEPTISGSELGRRLEVSPGWGRKLKKRLVPTERKDHDPNE